MANDGFSSAAVRVHSDRVIGPINRNIYGHFVEHLGRCVYGGLLAELLVNRKLCVAEAPDAHLADGWLPFGPEGGVRYALDESTWICGNRTQRIEVTSGDKKPRGICQPGISIQAGRSYRCSLHVRATGLCRQVTVALLSADHSRTYASHLIGDPFSSWARQITELTPDATDPEAVFAVYFIGPGTLWLDAISLVSRPEVGGVRSDVADAIAQLRPPVIRYPGGCFADGYHWRDGVGLPDRRNVVFDEAWKSWDPNDFGTDEFIAFCRHVNAEPYLCVNCGSGTVREAADWVAYCNGSPDTEIGAQRATNATREPYNVRYWGVGNELYGDWEIGHMDAESYGRRFLEFAAAMRTVDPSIELVAVGCDPQHDPEWNRRVLQIVGDRAEYLSVHRYVPMKTDASPDQLYNAIVAAPCDFEVMLQEVAKTIEDTVQGPNKPKIAFDEWNVWINSTLDENGLEEKYCLRDALFAAGVFHALQRQCQNVTMANIAQLVNVLGVIKTSPTGVKLTPIWKAFKLFADVTLSQAVPVTTESPSFSVPKTGTIVAMEDVPYLDAAATMSEDGGKLCITVVNRHREQDISADVELSPFAPAGEGRLLVLNGPSADSTNEIGDDTIVDITEDTVPVGETFRHTFPAHSVTAIVLSRA